jgi:hypothetical protein
VPAASSTGPVGAATEMKGDTGASEDLWARFCAGGEIASAAAATGVAASVAQQLQYVSVISACGCVVFMVLFLKNILVTGGRLRGTYCFGGADLGVFHRETVT